jgi:DNA-binding transcriptional MerR regulator
MNDRRWKVGELAAAAAVTVRTLHYFDEIGLLCPAERSSAGHRLYTSDDVRRLYEVLALRDLGMSLNEIAASLDHAGDDLQLPVQRQLEQVGQRISAQQHLRRRLEAILHAMQQARDPSVDLLIQTMEAMMQAKYFTPDQLIRLKERHREVGGEAFGRWQQQWAKLNEEAKAHVARGTDPSDPAVQALAQRWADLMDDMTGGDRRILSAMYAKLDGKGPEAATLGVVSAEAWDYIKRAFAVGFGQSS